MSEESTKSPIASGNSLAPKLTFIHDAKIEVKFEGSCSNQNITSFSHRNVVNLFIVYELDTCSKVLNTDFTLGDLFGAVRLTKNADSDK